MPHVHCFTYPDIANRWSMTSIGNRWVISWLVIDYWRWSMNNRWVIEASKFCGLSITHRWHQLVIDVIDSSSMTHRLLIGYYTAHDRHFSCFLVPMICFRLWFFYLCWTHYSLYLKFLLTMSRRKVLITNTDDSQLCSISLYLTLYIF